MKHDMKKILVLTAFAFAGLASSQETRDFSPSDNYNKAQEYAVQADVAYPISFYDRTLWKASVNHAYLASVGEPNNRDYAAYLAQLYTKTQWWVNAFFVWNRLDDLNETEKEWASLTATKLAYLALQRGDKASARKYVNRGLQWRENASLLAIRNRL